MEIADQKPHSKIKRDEILDRIDFSLYFFLNVFSLVKPTWEGWVLHVKGKREFKSDDEQHKLYHPQLVWLVRVSRAGE